MAGDARLGDALDRVVAGRREVLGDHHDERGHDDSGDGAQEQTAHAGHAGGAVLGGAQHPVGHRVEGDDGDDRRHAQALVESVHDARVLAAAEAHEERADDAGDDRDATQHERVGDDRRTGVRPEQEGQQHGRDGGDRVGLEQVGGHAGAVAHVVADVVGDHGGVARVVFGDAGFDLADQVGADVGGLGVDAAADPGEDRDQAAAEAQADQRAHGVVAPEMGAQVVVDGDAEQCQADDQQTGHRAAAEGDFERRAEALLGGLGGAHVDAHADHHADEAGRRRQAGAHDEAHGRLPAEAPALFGAERDAQDEKHDHAHHGDGPILAAQVGLGALLDGARHLAHLVVAGRLGQQPADQQHAVDHGHRTADHGHQHGVVGNE